jgi:protein-tyrosine phosphatase
MVRIVTRHLDWEGLFNARDLVGLAAADGRTTRRGALVRSENLDRLAPAGWQRLREHGVRSVVDLRNHVQGGRPGRRGDGGEDRAGAAGGGS